MRILVLGAAGMLGHKIYLHLKRRFPDTWAAVRKTKNIYEKLGVFEPDHMIENWNLADHGLLMKNLNSCRPNWIVNCAGVTTRKVDAAGLTQLIQINALLPHQLADWCESSGNRLIHFSTDCVFSGDGGPYTEASPRDATDPYGQSKSLGEVDHIQALTIRSSIIGFELGTPTELLGWLFTQKGRQIKGYTNALYSGVTTTWMAQAVEQIMTNHPKVHGIRQIASQPISKADLLAMVNSTFKLGCTLIPDASVVVDKRLSGERFHGETGIVVPSWPVMIEQLVEEYAFYQGLKGRSVA
jgi:dTDP-4-dehydrorhamnose reductase